MKGSFKEVTMSNFTDQLQLLKYFQHFKSWNKQGQPGEGCDNAGACKRRKKIRGA
jgi:hypothetical protein